MTFCEVLRLKADIENLAGKLLGKEYPSNDNSDGISIKKFISLLSKYKLGQTSCMKILIARTSHKPAYPPD